MNEVERLIWLHDRTGTAKSFLLSKEELDAIVAAAHAMGYRMESLK